jgi:hypothetical protein
MNHRAMAMMAITTATSANEPMMYLLAENQDCSELRKSCPTGTSSTGVGGRIGSREGCGAAGLEGIA